jgi:hypothetical protein
MSFISFDGRDVFLQRGLTEDLRCDDSVPIRSRGKPLLGSEKKEGCLIRGGLSFSINQGHLKLSESPASSGRMPICAACLQESSYPC